MKEEWLAYAQSYNSHAWLLGLGLEYDWSALAAATDVVFYKFLMLVEIVDSEALKLTECNFTVHF